VRGREKGKRREIKRERERESLRGREKGKRRETYRERDRNLEDRGREREVN